MSRLIATLSLFLFFGFAGIAIAQPPGDAPRQRANRAHGEHGEHDGPRAGLETPSERAPFGPHRKRGMGGPGMGGMGGMGGPGKGDRFGERKGPGSSKFEGRRRGGHPVERWLSRLSEHDPDLHTKLLSLRSTDPAGFVVEVRKHMMDRLPPGGRWGGPGGGPQRDARRPAFDNQTLIAIREAAAACRANRTPATEAELKSLLENAFETRQEQQRKYIGELESELAHIRRDVADLDAQRDDILQRNFNAILAMDPPPPHATPLSPKASEDDSE